MGEVSELCRVMQRLYWKVGRNCRQNRTRTTRVMPCNIQSSAPTVATHTGEYSFQDQA